MNRRAVLLLIALLLFPLTAVAASSHTPKDTAVNFDEIDAFIQAEMERAGIPGLALAVVQGDEVIYMKGYGRADETGTAVTPQTPFIIGSIGKTFAALAIQQLASQGEIDLNAPVQQYLPDFTLADAQAAAQITVQQLLDHTSGLPKTAGEQAYQLDPQYSTAELVQKAADVTPNRPVGVSREYSNLNYLLLGLIVEAVSGQSYTDYVREHIWRPLGMSHSAFSEAEAVGLADGYRTFYGLRVPAQIPIPTGMIPSGYAISSAEDLSSYLMAYLNEGRYTNKAGMSPTATDPVTTDNVYDIYWNRLPGSATSVETSQSGGTMNYNADIHMLPGQEVGVAVLTNTRHLWDDLLPVTTAASIAQTIAYQVAGWPTPEPPVMSLWQSYLLLDFLAFGLIGWAVFRLWRLIRSWGTAVTLNGRTVFSACLDFGLGILLLAAIPALSDQRWDYLLRTQPDLAGLVFGAGSILVVVGVARAVLLFTRRRQEPAVISVTAPS